MIRTITTTGKYLVSIGGSNASFVSKTGELNVGNVRFNTTMQCFEVYDGNNYVILPNSHTQLSLSPEAEQLLDYVREKQNKELEIKKFAEDNVAIKDLLQQIKDKENQLEMVYNLIKNQDKFGEDSWSL